MQQLKITNLSPNKRDQIQKTKDWLLRLLAQLETKQKEIESFTTSLSEAKERHAKYDREAARSETAATKLAAADIQISRLEPQLTKLPKSLGADFNTLRLQIDSVRKEDILGNFGDELSEQMLFRMRTALEPFFAPIDLPLIAQRVLVESPCYAQLVMYLHRPAPQITNLGEARAAVNGIVKELDAILSGETLIELQKPQDSPPRAKPPPPQPFWTEEQTKELRREGEEILKRANLSAQVAALGRAADARHQS